MKRTDDKTLIAALRILANDIQSQDGVANAAIWEAAQRLEELTCPPDDELLPCPFCGGAAELNEHEEVTFTGSYTANCSCDDCDIITNAGFGNTKNEAAQKAIKIWNTRHCGVKK